MAGALLADVFGDDGTYRGDRLLRPITRGQARSVGGWAHADHVDRSLSRRDFVWEPGNRATVHR